MTTAGVAHRVERARDRSAPPARRHAAFEELTRSFSSMALASAVRLLHDADEARDAAQDAFLAAWLKLDQLRDPAAFGGWLKRLIATECHRRLRKRHALSWPADRSLSMATDDRHDPPWPLTRALAALTQPERQAIVLFYVYGCTLQEIAGIAGVSPPTIGKRLFEARLKVRRALPACVRASMLRLRTRGRRPGPDDLADYVGVYRFEKRPDLLVEIRRSRCGRFLVSRGNGQQHHLYYLGGDTLATRSFDGEGRFQRDESGRIARFVYYEFGERLGVARRIARSSGGDRRGRSLVVSLPQPRIASPARP